MPKIYQHYHSVVGDVLVNNGDFVNIKNCWLNLLKVIIDVSVRAYWVFTS